MTRSRRGISSPALRVSQVCKWANECNETRNTAQHSAPRARCVRRAVRWLGMGARISQYASPALAEPLQEAVLCRGRGEVLGHEDSKILRLAHQSRDVAATQALSSLAALLSLHSVHTLGGASKAYLLLKDSRDKSPSPCQWARPRPLSRLSAGGAPVRISTVTSVAGLRRRSMQKPERCSACPHESSPDAHGMHLDAGNQLCR
jgi:hypothetical protein